MKPFLPSLKFKSALSISASAIVALASTALLENAAAPRFARFVVAAHGLAMARAEAARMLV